jgi:hypothetical protein
LTLKRSLPIKTNHATKIFQKAKQFMLNRPRQVTVMQARMLSKVILRTANLPHSKLLIQLLLKPVSVVSLPTHSLLEDADMEQATMVVDVDMEQASTVDAT